MKILCLFGMHRWTPWARYTYVGPDNVQEYGHSRTCKCCGRTENVKINLSGAL